MGRLVDIEDVKALINGLDSLPWEEEVDDLVDSIPTAFDVEKVAEEMEEHRANFDCRICKYNKTEGQVCLKDCTEALIDGLFDIVKRGGVDGKE